MLAHHIVCILWCCRRLGPVLLLFRAEHFTVVQFLRPLSCFVGVATQMAKFLAALAPLVVFQEKALFHKMCPLYRQGIHTLATHSLQVAEELLRIKS